MTPIPSIKKITAGAFLFGLFALPQIYSAANLTWDTTIASDATITDGSGTWTAGAGNWNDGTTSTGVSFATDDNVTFGTGAALGSSYTITLGGATTTVGSLAFNYTGTNQYIIGATSNSQAIAFTGGTGTITVSGAPTNSAQFNAAINGNFTVTGSSNKGIILIANGTQTSANTITVSANTLLQAGNNSATGSLGSAAVVNSGSLVYRRSGTLNMNNAVSGSGSVAYQLRAATVTLNAAGTYSGTTTFTHTGATTGASTVNWGVNDALSTSTAVTITPTTASSLTLDLKGFNQTIASLAGTTLAASDNIITNTGSASTLTINGTASTTYNGAINGSVNLSKAGSSTLALGGSNAYTGTTTITGGSLKVAAGGSINNSSLVTVGTGATFDNASSAAVTANLSLNEGAVLARTSGTGTFTPGALTITGDLTSASFTAITGGQFLAKAGTLTFNLTNITAGTYSLFTGSPTGAFSGVSVAATALSTFDSGATFAGSNIGGFDYTFTNATNLLQITVSSVPEPSTYAALVGLGVLGLAVTRRRRLR